MTLAHNGRCPKMNIGMNSEQISTVMGSNEPVQHDVTRKLCPPTNEKLNIILHPIKYK